MARLDLSFACWDYDRMKALEDGRVRPEGLDLTFVPLLPAETFYRQLRYEEFDVCEMSLSSYLLLQNDDDPPLVAIPVFPSRFFRHQSIYVNVESGIRAPEDLVGRRVGIPEYQMTAAIWQRGILSDDYGVSPDSVEYVTGAIARGGHREEKVPLRLPERFSVTPIGEGENLSDMLVAGEIDAVYAASPPAAFGSEPRVRHLFEDFVQVEKDYYARTRIFPIMHLVAIKRATFEAHPWIARSLMKAFDAALQQAYFDLRQRGALKYMLPWLQQHLADTVDALGEGYWDYGLDKNRHVLETALRYSQEQGLLQRSLSPEDLFVPEARSAYHL